MISKNDLEQILMLWVPDARITNYMVLGKGHGNTVLKVSTDRGSFLIKLNDIEKTEAEVKGLRKLYSANNVIIPKITGSGCTNTGYLILEFIEQGPQTENYWRLLGEKLAELHSHTNSQYGLDHDNFIGSLRQLNSFKSSWIDFFINNRLLPQLELASNQLSKKDITEFETLFIKIQSIIPEEAPSLIHGDLWSGNVMANNKGEPVLIDPAVYYGNREIEIAFTYLFGGFDKSFYNSYQSAFPMLPSFENRIDLYNLYPLLVHANIFGGSYIQQVKGILKRYI